MRKESPYVLEDLDPEEAARRARAREAYEKMYPLSDDPYGEKRMERVQTVAGVKRVFNQVARESGLGGLVDDQDSEQTRRLEAREVDRNAYREPSCRERCQRDSRSRRRPGWVTIRFFLPRPIVEGLSLLARSVAEREHAERRNAPRGQRRRYPGPLSGNHIGDARYVASDKHWYVWLIQSGWLSASSC